MHQSLTILRRGRIRSWTSSISMLAAWHEAMVKFGRDVGSMPVRGQIGNGGDKLDSAAFLSRAPRDHGIGDGGMARQALQVRSTCRWSRPFSAVPDARRCARSWQGGSVACLGTARRMIPRSSRHRRHRDRST